MSSVPFEENAPTAGTVSLGKYSAAAGLLGLILVGIVLWGGVMNSGNEELQKQFFSSYVYGLVFWTAITMGMYVLTVFNHMVRSTWTLSVLRILEAGGGWIPLVFMAIAFLPVVKNLGVIYPWMNPVYVAHTKEVRHKVGYLNAEFWTIRLAIYFAVWIFTSWAFRQSVMKQERTKDFSLENRRMSYAAPSFLLFAVLMTFAFVDWIMSLEPTWSSTMYALWFMISNTLGAYAIAVVMFNLNSDKAPFSSIVTKNVIKDQGNMLFVLTMLWAYTSLSQYLIIWNGNTPENTQYYVRRESLGWNVVGLAAIIGQFFVPFFVILSPRTKKNSPNLRSIAGWIFAVHIIDFTFIVAPALPAHLDRPLNLANLTVWGWDLVSLIGFGAIWMCGFSLMFKQAPAFPTYDTRLQEAKASAH